MGLIFQTKKMARVNHNDNNSLLLTTHWRVFNHVCLCFFSLWRKLTSFLFSCYLLVACGWGFWVLLFYSGRYTTLMKAVTSNCAEIVELFLKAGADVNVLLLLICVFFFINHFFYFWLFLDSLISKQLCYMICCYVMSVWRDCFVVGCETNLCWCDSNVSQQWRQPHRKWRGLCWWSQLWVLFVDVCMIIHEEVQILFIVAYSLNLSQFVFLFWWGFIWFFLFFERIRKTSSLKLLNYWWRLEPTLLYEFQVLFVWTINFYYHTLSQWLFVVTILFKNVDKSTGWRLFRFFICCLLSWSYMVFFLFRTETGP